MADPPVTPGLPAPLPASPLAAPPVDARFATPFVASPPPLSRAELQRLLSAAKPTIAGYPAAQRGFNRKYANATPESTGVDPEVLAALRRFEEQRAQSGKPMLSPEQTGKVIDAASNKRAVTPEKERSIWNIPGNAIDDLETLVKSIPRLPGALLHEGEAILDLPRELGKVDSLADVARLPGVRLIPGAYTVGNIADGTEGLREAATHPLFTLLDVLPGAKAAAELTPAAKLAREGAAARIAAGEPAALNRVNPITTSLTKRVLDSPEGPQLVNRALGNAVDMFADTRVAQTWQAAFGNRTRQTVKPVAMGNAELSDLVMTDKPIPPKYADIAPVIEATRATHGILTEGISTRYGLTPERAAQLTSDLQLNPGALDNLPPNEAAWLDDVKSARARLDQWQVDQGFLERVDGELYLPADARKLLNAQNVTLRASNDLVTRADKLFAKYLPADVRAGMKIDDLTWEISSNPDGWLAYRDALPAELHPAVDAYHAWANGGGTEALGEFKKAVNKLSAGRTRVGAANRVGPAANASGVTSLSEFGNLRAAVKKMEAAEKAVDKAARVMPSRFMPKLSDAAARGYIAYRFGDTPELLEQATDLYTRGMLDRMPGFSAKTLRETLPDGTRVTTRGLYDFFDDIAPTWKQLKADGFDPIYMHRVSPDQATAMSFPRVGVTDYTASSLKQRTLDLTPTVQDVTISLQHEGVELLKSRVTDDVISQVADRVSVSRADLEARYAAQAQRRAAIDPTLTEGEHLNHLINRAYEPYDPGSLFAGERPTLSGTPDTYIRRTDSAALRKMFQPDAYKIFSTLDPFTGAMRTSLLALSPRWHVNNILGGGIMLQAQTGWGVWKNASEAWEAASKLSRGMDPGLPPDFIPQLGGMQRDAAVYAVKAGGTLRRLIDDVRFGPGASELTPAREAGALKQGFDKLTAGSYKLNQKFDDFYRIMAYLDGRDAALTKGMTREEAVNMGMHQAARVLQDMTELTPFESMVMRQIFPFYNFYQHIMRYAVKYPIDHPLRVAVTAGLARNELDMLGGLPTGMLEAFTWGEPDENGDRQGMSLAGFNPFSSTAGLFTLTGWLGSTNPVARTVLDQLGIDTSTGQPDLFPQLTYDPQLGRLQIDTGDPITQLVANTIPQSQVVMELLGVKDDYARLRRTNPEAASRMLQSQLGFPVLLRKYNPAKTRITAELARQEAADKDKAAALKAGDYETLADDPRFADTIARLNELETLGTLGAYQPAFVQPSNVDLLRGAFANQVGVSMLPRGVQDAYAQQAAGIAGTPGTNRGSR